MLFGAQQVVRGSLKWASRLGISPFLVGLLLVAFGTSVPEMATAFMSAYRSDWPLVSGNLIGSNLFNILIVLGISTLFSPISISKKELKRNFPVLLFCTLSLIVALWDFHFDFQEAFAFVGLYCAYILFLLFLQKKELKEKNSSSDSSDSSDSSGYSYGGMAFQVILGFICLHFGGQGFIDSCFHWVQQLSWDSVKVGVIIVALGTSLPELVVSLWSLWKKEDILALGNILGSNLLNIWLILGLSRFFLPQGNPALVPSPVLYRDSLFLLGITVLLVLFLFLSRPHLLRKWQGLVFLALYGFYALYLL